MSDGQFRKRCLTGLLWGLLCRTFVKPMCPLNQRHPPRAPGLTAMKRLPTRSLLLLLAPYDLVRVRQLPVEGDIRLRAEFAITAPCAYPEGIVVGFFQYFKHRVPPCLSLLSDSTLSGGLTFVKRLIGVVEGSEFDFKLPQLRRCCLPFRCPD